MNFGFILLFGLILGSDMLILTLIHKRNAKKCNFDCSKCKNWDCMHDYCENKRNNH